MNVPSSSTVAQVTISFQHSVLPATDYDGTRDTYLSENDPSTNAGAEDELLVDGDDPRDSGRDKVVLLKWDISSGISDSSIVTSASITLNVVNKTRHVYNIYAMRRDWIEGQADWTTSDGATPWDVDGAKGMNDRGTTVLATLPIDLKGVQTVPLNSSGVALVQSWLANPSSNFGIIVANENASDGTDFSSSEASTAGYRPRLTITYTDSGATGNTEPSITITSPADGAIFDAGDNLPFRANASDADGSVALVEFFEGGNFLGDDNSEPYEFTWMNVAAGSYDLTAAATDNTGASTSSNVIRVTVQSPDGLRTPRFQDGVAPVISYAGTRDTYLSEENPDQNTGGEGTLLVDGDDPRRSGNDKATLLRWDISTIPQNSAVVAVTVVINVIGLTMTTSFMG